MEILHVNVPLCVSAQLPPPPWAITLTTLERIMIGEFTPWQLPNNTSMGFFPSEKLAIEQLPVSHCISVHKIVLLISALHTTWVHDVFWAHLKVPDKTGPPNSVEQKVPDIHSGAYGGTVFAQVCV